MKKRKDCLIGFTLKLSADVSHLSFISTLTRVQWLLVTMVLHVHYNLFQRCSRLTYDMFNNCKYFYIHVIGELSNTQMMLVFQLILNFIYRCFMSVTLNHFTVISSKHA